MVAPTVDMAQHLARLNVPIYMYTFNHAHQMYQQMKKQKPMGSWLENSSYHEIELNFVFGAPFTGKTVWYGGNFTHSDKEVSKVVMKLWSNFAKHGYVAQAKAWQN
jgi:carboxylesterase type B